MMVVFRKREESCSSLSLSVSGSEGASLRRARHFKCRTHTRIRVAGLGARVWMEVWKNHQRRKQERFGFSSARLSARGVFWGRAAAVSGGARASTLSSKRPCALPLSLSNTHTHTLLLHNNHNLLTERASAHTHTHERKTTSLTVV